MICMQGYYIIDRPRGNVSGPMMNPSPSGMRTNSCQAMRWIGLIFFTFTFACDRGAPSVAPPKPTNRLLIVASVFPLGSIAKQVGGDRVDVVWWVESGQALTGHQPTPEQVEQMRRAAAVLTNGLAEAQVTDQFSDAFGDRRVIRLDRFVNESLADSQLWLDATVAKQAAGALADRLASIDPAHAQAYRDRAAACAKELDALSAYGAQVLLELRGKVVCSIGNDYAALGRQMGFTVEPITRDPLVSLDETQRTRLPQTLKQRQAQLLLVEADSPPAVLLSLQNSVGVPVVRIDSLGSSSSRGLDSYEKLLRYNYEQLAVGLRQARGE